MARVRLNVKIGDDDELGTFIFRTTGFNSIRSLAARLAYYKAVSGNLLACLPLELRLRGKSTTQSHRSAIYYVDICAREGSSFESALLEARKTDARRKEVGFDQAALDEAGKHGFANAAFEFNEEEAPEIIEEFYPQGIDGNQGESAGTVVTGDSSPLRHKLDRGIAAQ